MFFRSMVRSYLRVTLAASLVCLTGLPVAAQQIVVETPMNGAGHSFYENIGFNFGFNIGGAQPGPNGQFGNSAVVGLNPQGGFTPGGALPFRQGGFGVGVPFGMGDPNAQANFGFGVLGGGGGGAFFGITAGQGSSSSISSISPSVTVPHGGGGFIFDAIQQPFVTGIIPVVGGGPTYVSPLAERLQRLSSEGLSSSNSPALVVEAQPSDPAQRLTEAVGGTSTAARGDVSVAEIRRRQSAADAERQAEIESLIAQGHSAEEDDEPAMAIIYYRMAASRAEGRQREELQAKVEELNSLLGR